MSKHNKHTPGPWTVTQDTTGCIYVASPHCLHNDICDLYHIGADTKKVFTKENAEANAHLIAAAPEMLAMLKELLEFIEEENNYGNERLQNLIAKAQGDQQ